MSPELTQKIEETFTQLKKMGMGKRHLWHIVRLNERAAQLVRVRRGEFHQVTVIAE